MCTTRHPGTECIIPVLLSRLGAPPSPPIHWVFTSIGSTSRNFFGAHVSGCSAVGSKRRPGVWWVSHSPYTTTRRRAGKRQSPGPRTWCDKRAEYTTNGELCRKLRINRWNRMPVNIRARNNLRHTDESHWREFSRIGAGGVLPLYDAKNCIRRAVVRTRYPLQNLSLSYLGAEDRQLNFPTTQGCRASLSGELLDTLTLLQARTRVDLFLTLNLAQQVYPAMGSIWRGRNRDRSRTQAHGKKWKSCIQPFRKTLSSTTFFFLFDVDTCQCQHVKSVSN